MILVKEYSFHDNGKPPETMGRKAIGPFKWQPSHRKKSFFFF